MRQHVRSSIAPWHLACGLLLLTASGCASNGGATDASRDATMDASAMADVRSDVGSEAAVEASADAPPRVDAPADISPVTDASTDSASSGYYDCPAAFITPASHVSWIRDVYLRDNDYPVLGCPVGPEGPPTTGPWAGQTDSRFVYQQYANGTCIGWDWSRGCGFASEPGYFTEMPCTDVGNGAEACGFHPIVAPGTLDCDAPPRTGVLTRCRASDHLSAYYLLINNDFATTTPQHLTFLWHGCSTSVDYIRSGIDLEGAATTAGDHGIFVYPLSVATNDHTVSEMCFSEAASVGHFERVLSDLQAAYDIDATQVFSAGYSSGGIVSDYLGCRSGNVRAIAAVEGGMQLADATPSSCTHQTDAFIIHNPDDRVVGWNWGSNAYWGYRGLTALYASNACSAGASFCSLTTLNSYTMASQSTGMPRGTCDFTCPSSRRVRLWLHSKVDTWNAGTPSGITYHTVPDGAALAIWNFFNHR